MVDSGPAAIATTSFSPDNYLYVTVNVCQPGTTTCATVDHVQVSTQTSGLRVLASAVTGVSLTSEADPAKGGNTLAECYQLQQGTAWGNVVTADVQISGETAASVPVQIISTPNATPNQATCPSNGFIRGDTAQGVQELGANGVLGLAPLAQDCTGQGCVNQYFTCQTNPGGSVNCQSNVAAAPPTTAQVTNPVTMFATDKNGVIISIPAVDATTGAPSGFSGTITFGIGTQSNNAYGATVTALAADPATGSVTTSYTSQKAGSQAANFTSWFDTAGVGYYFTDAGITPMCTTSGLTTFYCPAQPLNLQASVTGAGGQGGPVTVNFTVANAETLNKSNQNSIVFSSLGATPPGVYGSNAFVWGLPFFFGRTVFIAYPGASITRSAGGALSGPFYAF